ncbi:MAG: hypothetical protein BHW37_05850 [Firmicutes bacterium CAG:272_52_7]|nr:MAG: hypothetical protein BHW37_05850 [Firmicutes bacterium CAG:272_52_7]
MRGVKPYEAHAVIEHAVLYPFDKPVVNLFMSHMSPPDEDIGIVEDAVRQALVGIRASSKAAWMPSG